MRLQYRTLAAAIVLALFVSGCGATPEVIPSAATLTLDPGMSREAAVADLISDTFLPEQDAGCVIDALFADTGTYNPKSAPAAEIDTAELVSECTFVEEDEDGDRESTTTESTIDLSEIEELEVTDGEIAKPYELTDETQPTFTPGGTATGTITLDGKDIEVVTITPPGFRQGDAAPVFLAFPPGGQDLAITQNVAFGVYANQAVRRGWVVVSPAAPGAQWSGSAAQYAPELVRWISGWVTIEGGRPHIGGMSNGGISAFHIAAQNPGMFKSLVAFPGFPDNKTDQAALAQIAEIPVTLWVGGADSAGWITSVRSTAEELESLGGDVQLNVLPGEPHVLISTQDGQAIFTALDAAR